MIGKMHVYSLPLWDLKVAKYWQNSLKAFRFTIFHHFHDFQCFVYYSLYFSKVIIQMKCISLCVQFSLTNQPKII